MQKRFHRLLYACGFHRSVNDATRNAVSEALIRYSTSQVLQQKTRKSRAQALCNLVEPFSLCLILLRSAAHCRNQSSCPRSALPHWYEHRPRQELWLPDQMEQHTVWTSRELVWGWLVQKEQWNEDLCKPKLLNHYNLWRIYTTLFSHLLHLAALQK